MNAMSRSFGWRGALLAAAFTCSVPGASAWAQSASTTNAAPPFLLNRGAVEVKQDGEDYVLKLPDGTSERWTRRGTVYYGPGGARFEKAGGEYIGTSGERYTPAGSQWIVQGSSAANRLPADAGKIDWSKPRFKPAQDDPVGRALAARASATNAPVERRNPHTDSAYREHLFDRSRSR